MVCIVISVFTVKEYATKRKLFDGAQTVFRKMKAYYSGLDVKIIWRYFWHLYEWLIRRTDITIHNDRSFKVGR